MSHSAAQPLALPGREGSDRAGPGEIPMAGEGENDAARPELGGAEAPSAAKGKLFLRLFLENERRLYAYILTLLANRADADDVLQEASLVMWDKFDERQPPADFT